MEKVVDMIKERLHEINNALRNKDAVLNQIQCLRDCYENEENFLKSLLAEIEKLENPTEPEMSSLPKPISVKKSAVIYKIYEEIQQVISKYDDSVILPALLVLESEYKPEVYPIYPDIMAYSDFIRALRGIVSPDEYLQKFQEAWGDQGSIDEFLTPEPEIEEEKSTDEEESYHGTEHEY